ncbi:hypothetical protein [Streptomyces sp. NPDC059994]|uniref:hypothetical protein n=1 Tax=Streptomyces sp. NPDC059994 TaxID=3347029 RepID=UPI0036C56A1E
MNDRTTPQAPAAARTAELESLITAGEFWRLAPEWWPPVFEARPSLESLRAMEAGLLRRLESAPGGAVFLLEEGS